jgi:hypothetical protein
LRLQARLGTRIWRAWRNVAASPGGCEANRVGAARSRQPVLPARLLAFRPFDAGGVDEGDLGVLALEELSEGEDLEAGVGAAPVVLEAADRGGSLSTARVGVRR